MKKSGVTWSITRSSNSGRTAAKADKNKSTCMRLLTKSEKPEKAKSNRSNNKPEQLAPRKGSDNSALQRFRAKSTKPKQVAPCDESKKSGDTGPEANKAGPAQEIPRSGKEGPAWEAPGASKGVPMYERPFNGRRESTVVLSEAEAAGSNREMPRIDEMNPARPRQRKGRRNPSLTASITRGARPRQLRPLKSIRKPMSTTPSTGKDLPNFAKVWRNSCRSPSLIRYTNSSVSTVAAAKLPLKPTRTSLGSSAGLGSKTWLLTKQIILW